MEWGEIYRRLARDSNDAAAWSALELRVRRWALRGFRGRGWDATEDAVADTCAAAVLSLGRAYGAETFSGYAYGYYLNVCRRMRRETQEPLVRLGEQDLQDPSETGHGDAESSEEQLVALRGALRELPARQRRAVVLRYFSRKSAAEIGAALDVTEGNARWLVCDGLARLHPGGVEVSQPTLAGGAG
jgi:RNA polymerase sigma factor (sigma-70 family)